jgi:hypothetical protein
MDVAETKRLCALALRAGREEVCPGEDCPLWEDGGCALELLTRDGELYADEWSADLAAPGRAYADQVQSRISG